MGKPDSVYPEFSTGRIPDTIPNTVTGPTTFEEATVRICKQLAVLVVDKNKDYGKNNILEFGMHGILVRVNDKFARLKNLILNQKNPVNEVLDDTWWDIAGYAVVALLVKRGWFELPLIDEETEYAEWADAI